MDGDLRPVPAPSSELLKEETTRTELLRNGVIGKLTEVLSQLNKTSIKPKSPIDFLRAELGATIVSEDEVNDMERQLGDAHRELRRLTQILHSLGVNNVDELLSNPEYEKKI